MQGTRAKLLIVDDEPSIRESMSLILADIGYSVRTAEEGFSALIELRKEIPDILLSDLNMPGMSGFELLSVVRRRFPSVLTVAMTGMFTGDEVLSGIAATAFYQKGCGIASVLKVFEALPGPNRVLAKLPAASVPIWIQRNGHDSSGVPFVTIACPECLRTFPQYFDNSICQMHQTDCAFCSCLIQFAIVEPVSRGPAKLFEMKPADRKQEPCGAAQFYY